MRTKLNPLVAMTGIAVIVFLYVPMLAVAVVSVLITYLAMSGGSPHRCEPPTAKKAPGVAQTPDSPLSPAGIPVTEPLRSPELQQPSQRNGLRTAGAAAGNHARVPETAVTTGGRAASTPAVKPLTQTP